MKNGLAIWHYPHRTTVENVEYFENADIATLECASGYLFECKYPESDEKIARSSEIWKGFAV